MAKVLLIPNTNKEEFYAYMDLLEMNVDGVISVDVIESNIFTGDYILILNGERCTSVRYDNTLNSITLFIEREDVRLETLLNIWNYSVNNYIVDILEDEL